MGLFWIFFMEITEEGVIGKCGILLCFLLDIWVLG